MIFNHLLSLILLGCLVEYSFQRRALLKQAQGPSPNAYQNGNMPSQGYIQTNGNQNQYVAPSNSAPQSNQENPYQPSGSYQQISGYQQPAPQQQPSQQSQQQQPSSYQVQSVQPSQPIQPCLAAPAPAAAAPLPSSGGGYAYPAPSSDQSGQSGGAYKNDNSLYCYSCNENSASCSGSYISQDFLTPCNGQCMMFRNPNDGYKWYRGCSWDRGFNEYEPPVVSRDNTVYYFCNYSGCNA